MTIHSKVFLPIIMVLPVVSALNLFKSLGNQYISLLSFPIALLRATAAIMFILISLMCVVLLANMKTLL